LQKPDHLVCQIGLSGFSRLDRVQVGFGDFVCLGKIWSYPTQGATSCYRCKYRTWPIVIYNQPNQLNLHFSYFCPSFLFFSFFLQLDLLAASTTSKIVMVHTSPPCRRCLARGGAPHRSLTAPLTTVGPNKIRQSSLSKPDDLISTVLSRGFHSLFVLCGNTFW
jgi:hypothetical protein